MGRIYQHIVIKDTSRIIHHMGRVFINRDLLTQMEEDKIIRLYYVMYNIMIKDTSRIIHHMERIFINRDLLKLKIRCNVIMEENKSQIPMTLKHVNTLVLVFNILMTKNGIFLVDSQSDLMVAIIVVKLITETLGIAQWPKMVHLIRIFP